VRWITSVLLAVLALVSGTGPAAAHDGGMKDGKLSPAAVLESQPTLRARRVDAHLIEEWHESHGHHQWDGGLGSWGHSWATFRVQAHQLRAYLRSAERAIHDFALVWHWAAVAECESSGNWSINTGNSYYGGLQFSLPTWWAYGGHGMPNQQPAWYQATIADRVRTQSGLHHWPVCGRNYR
jgi:Transglycosylase-like domain